MFEPKYKVTSKLLGNIKRIAEIVTLLNERRFPRTVILELEKEAREVSAHASTSIEGNPLPLTEVKRILKNRPEHIRDTEREVLNYNNALKDLKKLSSGSRGLTLDLMLKIHKQVTAGLLPKYAIGKIRKEPVFVNDPRTGKTVFWPPDHGDVQSMLKDLFTFTKTSTGDVDPLIVAGIFHKQFVLIHPFIDGNGRTVRLATKVLLAGMGVDTFNLFSFERYYNTNVTKYFAVVGEEGNYYDLEIDFTEWLEYFTDGILDELLRVQGEVELASLSPASGFKEHHRVIIKYLKESGSITDAIYAGLVGRAKATRALDFKFLLEQKIITRHGKGRGTYYSLKK